MLIVDLETTSVLPLDAEIITGYFISCNPDLSIKSEFEFKAKPRLWSYEAEKIHGITKEEADTFPTFKEAYPDLIAWIREQKSTEFWCHANANMFGKNSYYDHAVLRMRFAEMNDEDYFVISMMKPYSTHTLAKHLQSHFNFEGFKLNMICKTLGIQLKHHDAKSDALACYEIIKKLLPLTSKYDLQNMRYENESTITNPAIKTNPKRARGLPIFN